MSRLLSRWSSMHRDRRIAHLTAWMFVALFAAVTSFGGAPDPIPLTTLAVAASVTAFETTGACVGLLGLAAVWTWVSAGFAPDTWWSLPAALCLLGFQCCFLLATGGADQTSIARPVLNRWATRTLTASALVAAGASLVLLATGAPRPSAGWLVPLGLFVIAATFVAVARTHVPTD